MSPKRTGMHFLFCFVDLALIAPNIRWIRRFSAAAQHLIMVHFNLSPLIRISKTVLKRINYNKPTIKRISILGISFYSGYTATFSNNIIIDR